MAVMQRMIAILFALALLGVAFAARADTNQVEAREVARLNNCTPTKVDVYQQSLGSEGATLYRVGCALQKTSDASAAKGADALLISCRENLCELLRPMTGENK